MNQAHGLAVVAAAAALACSSAKASVVYDNGPINGTINATGISSSQAIGNTFTLATNTAITSVSFGTWIDAGYSLDSVEWGITDMYGVLPTFKMAAVTIGDILRIYETPFGSLEVREGTFLTGGATLSPGTYYLWLRKALGTGPNSGGLWDVNNGSSLAYFSVNDVFIGPVTGVGGPGKTGSNSFKLISSGAVPEPGTWLLLIGGFGLAGAELRRRTMAPAQSPALRRRDSGIQSHSRGRVEQLNVGFPA